MGDLWSTNNRIKCSQCIITPQVQYSNWHLLYLHGYMFSRVTVQHPVPYRYSPDKVVKLRHQMEGRVLF